MAVGDLNKGATIEFNGELYTVVDYSHTFKGRGKATAATKLKHLLTGKVISKTFSDSDRFERVRLEERKIKYLYQSGDEYIFMDNETFDQFSFTEAQVEELKGFMLDGLDMTGMLYNGEWLKVELPITVEAKIVETAPGVKGDTVSGGDKPAKLESGAEVKVHLLVKEGDVIKVNTRTGKYIARV